MIRWFEEHNKLSWGITIFGAVMIFYLSSISFDFSGVGEAKVNFVSMIYHVSAFFCLAFFFFISVRRTNCIFVFSIFIVMFYALMDEIHQLYIAGRFYTFSDFALDTIGILFASMIYFIFVRYRVTEIQNL